jgi:hypothetical protein
VVHLLKAIPHDGIEAVVEKQVIQLHACIQHGFINAFSLFHITQSDRPVVEGHRRVGMQ